MLLLRDLKQKRKSIVFAAGSDANARDKRGQVGFASFKTGGWANIMMLLILSGADVDVPSNENVTPLIFAAASGQELSARLLIEWGRRNYSDLAAG